MKKTALLLSLLMTLPFFCGAQELQCARVLISQPKIIVRTDILGDVLTARDAGTQEVLWTKKSSFLKSMIGSSFHIQATSPDGTLFVLDVPFKTKIMDSKTGQLLYSVSSASVYFTDDNQYIFTRSRKISGEGGKINVLDARTGTVLYSTAIPTKVLEAARTPQFSSDFSAHSGTVTFKYSTAIHDRPATDQEMGFTTYYKTLIIDMETRTESTVMTPGPASNLL